MSDFPHFDKVQIPEDQHMVSATGATSRANEPDAKQLTDIVSFLAPLSEFALMNEIYSGGPPSPKQKPTLPQAKLDSRISEPVIPISKATPEFEKPMQEFDHAMIESRPDEPAEQVVEVDNQSSSSRFSKSESREPNEKEILRQKLEQLKEKLKKAKSLQEKTKLLEKQRDQDLSQQRKSEEKAQRKREEIEKKQERASHTTVVDKPLPPKQIKEVPEKKKEIAPVRPAQVKVNDSVQQNPPHKNKLHLVDELATRWWYALPEWPPADFNYNQGLKQNNLELVEPSKLREESNQTRVCAVEGYEGVYRDATGTLHDLRPKDSMPSLKNFQKRSLQELQQLVKQAYTAQLQQLQDMQDGKLQSYDRELEAQLIISLKAKLRSLASYV